MRRKSGHSAGGAETVEKARQRIIDAARELMAEQGFSSTTMQQIVARADTSIGNAYFYFDNKQHLLDQIVSAVANAQWLAIDRYLDTLETVEEQLAAGLFLNYYPPVSGAVPELGLSSEEPEHPVLDAFQQKMRSHYLQKLPGYLPDYSTEELAFIIDAWVGAGRNIALARSTGKLNRKPGILVRDLVMFSLRAIGFDQQQQQLADKAVNDVLATGLKTIFQTRSGG